MRLMQLMMMFGGKFSQNDFTYSGTYEWVDEGDNDWHINFTTDGTLTLKKALKADLYLLGGGQSGGTRDRWTSGSATYVAGGKGGQGGFISMPSGVLLLPGAYTITIGQGGAEGDLITGGTTTFGSFSAPGGGSDATGYFGGASGGAAGYNHGSNTPYAGKPGADSDVYDFDGINRGGGGSGGYSYKSVGSSTSYNYVAAGGGSQGGGHAMTSQQTGAVEALANYGGGGYGYGSSGGGSHGGSGFVQIRNAR